MMCAMAPEFRELVEQLVGDAMRNDQLSLAQAKQLQIHTFASLAVALHRGNGHQARLMFQPQSIEDNLRGTGLRPLPSLPVSGTSECFVLGKMSLCRVVSHCAGLLCLLLALSVFGCLWFAWWYVFLVFSTFDSVEIALELR